MISLPAKRGLLAYLHAQGWVLRERAGNWFARNAAGAEDDAAIGALIAAYDELLAIKRDRIAAIKVEGLARIREVFQAVADFEELKLVANIIQSIAPAARTLTVDMTSAAAIWAAGQSAIAAVNAALTAAEVEAVAPAWPA